MFPYGDGFNNNNTNNDMNNNNVPVYFVNPIESSENNVYNNIFQYQENYLGDHLRTEVFYPPFNEVYVNNENNEINEGSPEYMSVFNDIYMYNNYNNHFYEESDSIDEDNEISKVKTTKHKTSSFENENNDKENIDEINNKKSECILLDEEKEKKKEKDNDYVIDFYSEDRKKNHHEETLSLFKNKNKTLKNKGKKNITPTKRFLKHKQKRKEK